MKKINRILFFCTGAVGLAAGGFFVHHVLAAEDDNVHGWAWSENIGWVSMNSEDISSESGGGGESGGEVDGCNDLVDKGQVEGEAVAMSADGKYQTVAEDNYRGLMISSDYGLNWDYVASANYKNCYAVKMSANIDPAIDGKYQTAICKKSINNNTFIYVSSDYGANWTEKEELDHDDGEWIHFLEVSDSGKYQLAARKGRGSGPGNIDALYVSSDYGQTWQQKYVFFNNIADLINRRRVAMSTDGNYILLSDSDLYGSVNHGGSWTKMNTGGGSHFSDLILSADGKYQAAADSHARLYVSNNYGQSWERKTIHLEGNLGGKSWTIDTSDVSVLAMSGDGKYWLAAKVVDYASEYLFASADYGETWSIKGNGGVYYPSVCSYGGGMDWLWVGGIMSRDGSYQTAIGAVAYNKSASFYSSSDFGNAWDAEKRYDSHRDECITAGDLKEYPAISFNGECRTYLRDDHIYVSSGCGGNSGSPGGANYGVNIAGDGIMSGYAWSENIGWVSFNAADAAGCGGCSDSGCQAKVNQTLNGSGEHEVSGWAKVLANGGGWDGCVSLRGANYGVSIDPATGDFHGWAWSDMVLGWVSFNSVDSGAGGGPYKVHTSAGFAPTAKMECGGAGANCVYGTCDNNAGGSWIAYSPTQDCPICIYPVTDVSEGNVACAYWTLSGPANYEYQASGPGQTINLSAFANKIVPGDYTLSLRVSNKISAGCVSGNTDTATRAIVIKQGIDANFVCALGDPIYDEETNPEPAPWQDCTSSAGKADFAKKIVSGGKIYVKDVSLHSEEATDIVDWNWQFTVDGKKSTDNAEMVSFTAGRNNKIELKVFDNGGRTNCKEADFSARSLPKWEEVPI